MPHFAHVIFLSVVGAKAEVLTDNVVIGVRIISSRPGDKPRITTGGKVVRWVSAGGGVDVQTAGDIDPDEPTNIAVLLAFEWIQVSPHSF